MTDYTTLGIVISAGVVSILAGLKCIKSIRFGNCCVLDTREIQGNEGQESAVQELPPQHKPRAFFAMSGRPKPPASPSQSEPAV